MGGGEEGQRAGWLVVVGGGGSAHGLRLIVGGCACRKLRAFIACPPHTNLFPIDHRANLSNSS